MIEIFKQRYSMPKIVFGARGCGKALSAQEELDEFLKNHPGEKVILAKHLHNLQVSPMKTYPEEALKFIEQTLLHAGHPLSEFEKENLYKTLRASHEQHKKQKE